MTAPIPDDVVEAAARAYLAAKGYKVRHLPQDTLWLAFNKSEEMRAMRAAMTAALPLLNGWRPIETAPRDESRFLFTNGQFVGVGFYLNGRHFAADNWRDERNTEPTHWQPLPVPPPPATGETK